MHVMIDEEGLLADAVILEDFLVFAFLQSKLKVKWNAFIKYLFSFTIRTMLICIATWPVQVAEDVRLVRASSYADPTCREIEKKT